jgi:hypothetical protein
MGRHGDRKNMNEDVKKLDERPADHLTEGRREALHSDTCVSCGHMATAFKNEISRKEYGISGLCQLCQDKVWG